MIAGRFKESSGEVISLTGFDEKLYRREELVRLIDKLGLEKTQIEQELKIYLGNAEIAENNHFQVSWKPVETNRIDTKLLKMERPDIYEQYQKSSTSRRFTIKAA